MEPKNRFKTPIAAHVFRLKYAIGEGDSWDNLARRVVDSVCGTCDGTVHPTMSEGDRKQLVQYIAEMKFIPGGRYLYYAGREAKFWNNCFILRAEADTREEWASVVERSMSCLMVGGGIGIDYSILRPGGYTLRRTGGKASGPLPLMQIVNEAGRNVMQGGSRRSAIYASLNWQHEDAAEFMVSKNWRTMPIGNAKIEGEPYTLHHAKMEDFNFHAPLDMTNISLNYDDAFLNLGKDRDKGLGGLPETFLKNCKQAMRTGEPGFSFNFGAKQNETLRNAPVSADTQVLTSRGYRQIKDIANTLVEVWTGKQWASTTFTKTKELAPILVVKFSGGQIKADPSHEFIVNVCRMVDDHLVIDRQGRVAAADLRYGDMLHVSLPWSRRTYTDVVSIEPGEPEDVYCCDVGVEEHSFCAEGVIISNCTEVVSEDDSDVCNLGSINMGDIGSIEEFKDVITLASKFLVCGTIRADLPYAKVYKVREKNRRLGLGLMGIHEWLLKHGSPYEVTPELHKWLEVYEKESKRAADEHCERLYLSQPVAYRAIAPTGSIGILASTTTGIEPLFAVAYKRRYLTEGTHWKYEFVVDSTADHLIKEHGVDPEKIQTAYSLSTDYERRIKFQADIQDYVDMSISSTINLPPWGTDANNEDRVEAFAMALSSYCKRLRGFTCYPDGSRGGQPITEVPYSEAIQRKGVVYEENDVCEISGKGGSCGS